jgi:hypothetical protein
MRSVRLLMLPGQQHPAVLQLLLCVAPAALGSAKAVWWHLLVLGRRLHARHTCCGRKAVLVGVLLLLLLLLGRRCQGLLHLLQHGLGHAAVDGRPAPTPVDHVCRQRFVHFRGQAYHLLLQLQGQGRESRGQLLQLRGQLLLHGAHGQLLLHGQPWHVHALLLLLLLCDKAAG